MDLFSKKDELINQIFIITKEVLSFLSDESFDDYEKLSNIYNKRQKLIDEINELDVKIKDEGLSLNDYPETKKSMSITLEGIKALDDKISEILRDKSAVITENIKNVKEGRKGLDMTRSKELVTGFKLDISK